VRRCLVRAMYLSASEAACLAWVRYNKLMFTFFYLTLILCPVFLYTKT